LDAILGTPRSTGAAPESTVAAKSTGEPLLVDIERISPGRGQPRRNFDEAALVELADSIRVNGILQPLLVVEANGSYELIAGERRLRAASRAGLAKVPVIVRRDVSDDRMLELALIENVQRADLTPIEQARGYQRLIDDHGYTQDQLAQRIGKSRAAVSNALRLLKLPRDICDLVDQGKLSEGHARALLGLRTAAQQIRLGARAARKGLSVRQMEELVRRFQETASRSVSATRAPKSVTTELHAVEQSLGRALGTKVRVHGGAARGRIEIEFYSPDELDRLIERLGARRTQPLGDASHERAPVD
jgi:ParB family chromosome partitioning protein